MFPAERGYDATSVALQSAIPSFIVVHWDSVKSLDKTSSQWTLLVLE